MAPLKLYEYSDTKAPKQLVIMLHGYGASGQNLLDLSQEFKEVLPEAHFIAPNAYEHWEGGFPNSYQWFSLYSGMERKPLSSVAGNIIAAKDALKNLISEQLARFNLQPKDLILVGFSQGAMMALYYGISTSEMPAGIIAYSGKLILPESLGEKMLSKPKICLIHGKQDSIVPFNDFLEAKKVLEEKKFPFEAHAISNLDHSIDLTGIGFAKDFLKKL